MILDHLPRALQPAQQQAAGPCALGRKPRHQPFVVEPDGGKVEQQRQQHLLETLRRRFDVVETAAQALQGGQEAGRRCEDHVGKAGLAGNPAAVDLLPRHRCLAEQRRREEQAEGLAAPPIEELDLVGLTGLEEQHLVALQAVLDPVDLVTRRAARNPFQRKGAVAVDGGEVAGKAVQDADVGRAAGRTIAPPPGASGDIRANPVDADPCLHPGSVASRKREWKRAALRAFR
jgi:hypothetical protein